MALSLYDTPETKLARQRARLQVGATAKMQVYEDKKAQERLAVQRRETQLAAQKQYGRVKLQEHAQRRVQPLVVQKQAQQELRAFDREQLRSHADSRLSAFAGAQRDRAQERDAGREALRAHADERIAGLGVMNDAARTRESGSLLDRFQANRNPGAYVSPDPGIFQRIGDVAEDVGRAGLKGAGALLSANTVTPSLMGSMYGTPGSAGPQRMQEKPLTESYIPEPALQRIGETPFFGETLEETARYGTSPLAIATLGAAPGSTLYGAGAGVLGGFGGQALDEAGVPETPLGDWQSTGMAAAGIYGGPGKGGQAALDVATDRVPGVAGARLRAAGVRPIAGAGLLDDIPIDDNALIREVVDDLRIQEASSAEIMGKRASEFGTRQQSYDDIYEGLVKEGMPRETAHFAAVEQLQGEYERFIGIKPSFAPDSPQAARLWGMIDANKGLMPGEARRSRSAFIKYVQGVGLQPNEIKLLGRTFGDEFEQALVSAQTKMREAHVAQRMAQGVQGATGPRPDYMDIPEPFIYRASEPNIPGSEQLPLVRGEAAEFTPRATPARSAIGGDDVRLDPNYVPGYGERPKATLFQTDPWVESADPLIANQPNLPDIFPSATIEQVTNPTGAHFFDVMADSTGILKAGMSSMDMSAFRQTAKGLARHPGISRNAFKAGLQAMKSEDWTVQYMARRAAEGIEDGTGPVFHVRTPDGAIREIASGQWAKEKLWLAVPGTPEFQQSGIMARPEFFVSRTAANAPGIRQSGRSFATVVNTTMQDEANYWLPKFEKLNGGALSPRLMDTAADFIKRLNGQGTLGTNWFAQALKALGFAPGYRASGPQALAHLFKSPVARPGIGPIKAITSEMARENRLIQRMAAEELLTWATLGSTILTAAKYGAGAAVITEVTNPQFGRIQFPGSDTYYNIWGTDQVLARTILQGLMGKKTDSHGNVTPLGNQEGGWTGLTTGLTDAVTQYLKSGQDPIVGLMAELSTGETYIGKPLKWDLESVKQLVLDRVPLIAQDMRDVYNTDGLTAALASAPSSFTGTAGVSSYKPTREIFRSMPRFNTASLEVTQAAIPGAPAALNLTANEERKLQGILREDFKEYMNDLETRLGPRPDEMTVEQVMAQFAQERGLDSRMAAGLLFIHRADRHPEWRNMESLKYGLQHEDELGDYYPDFFNSSYMDTYRAAARERGLIE